MHSDSATRGSPAGCIVGTFSILAFIFTLVCGFLLWEALQTPDEERPDGFLNIPIGTTVFGLLITLISGRISTRMLSSTDWKNFDPEDPSSHL